MLNRSKCNHVNRNRTKKKEHISTLNLFMYSSCVYTFLCDAGDTPYPGIRSRDLISLVKNGQRMKRPEFANDL